VLGHLAPVDHGADRQADFGLAAQRRALAPDGGGDGGKLALGGAQEVLPLARALRGERMIAAQDQALAGIIR
jgi:hypothetical protein